MDYTKRTRQDWINFEKAKAKAFEPTQEEIENERIKQENKRKLLPEEKIKNLWINRPEKITKEWAIWFLNAIDAKQYIWDDIDWWIETQEIVFWSIDKAFDDLVIRYL